MSVGEEGVEDVGDCVSEVMRTSSSRSGEKQAERIPGEGKDPTTSVAEFDGSYIQQGPG